MDIVELNSERYSDVVDALWDAFREYPVMRFVIGDAGADYDERGRLLVGYFTQARMARGWPALGVAEGSRLLAAANLSPPESIPAPPELKRSYAELGERLGRPAIDRFEAFAASEDPFIPQEPHYYLGMIGVRREHQGRGLARLLLERIHDLSAAHPRSTGVRLTTELESNLPFYERFGYRVAGHVQLDGLESWSMFRPDAP